MGRTILLSISDVLLVDEDGKTETETKKLRFGRVRLFVLSLLLGLSLGSMLCVVEPARSRDVSVKTRALLKNALEITVGSAEEIVGARR
jgi:hypothetical protein